MSDFVRKNASGTLSFPQCRAGGRKKETLKSTLFKKMEPLPTLTHHHKNQQRGAPTFTFFSFETRQKLRSFIYWNNLILFLLSHSHFIKSWCARNRPIPVFHGKTRWSRLQEVDLAAYPNSWSVTTSVREALLLRRRSRQLRSPGYLTITCRHPWYRGRLDRINNTILSS